MGERLLPVAGGRWSGQTEQVAGKRSKPVAMTILKGVEDRAKGIDGIWSLVEHVSALATELF